MNECDECGAVREVQCCDKFCPVKRIFHKKSCSLYKVPICTCGARIQLRDIVHIGQDDYVQPRTDL